MSYLGARYDAEFRLAIVGMDHGDFMRATLLERQRGILKWYVGLQNDFTPHYAGVVRTATAILGKSAAHCQTFAAAGVGRRYGYHPLRYVVEKKI